MQHAELLGPASEEVTQSRGRPQNLDQSTCRIRVVEHRLHLGRGTLAKRKYGSQCLIRISRNRKMRKKTRHVQLLETYARRFELGEAESRKLGQSGE